MPQRPRARSNSNNSARTPPRRPAPSATAAPTAPTARSPTRPSFPSLIQPRRRRRQRRRPLHAPPRPLPTRRMRRPRVLARRRRADRRRSTSFSDRETRATPHRPGTRSDARQARRCRRRTARPSAPCPHLRPCPPRAQVDWLGPRQAAAAMIDRNDDTRPRQSAASAVLSARGTNAPENRSSSSMMLLLRIRGPTASTLGGGMRGLADTCRSLLPPHPDHCLGARQPTTDLRPKWTSSPTKVGAPVGHNPTVPLGWRSRRWMPRVSSNFDVRTVQSDFDVRMHCAQSSTPEYAPSRQSLRSSSQQP